MKQVKQRLRMNAYINRYGYRRSYDRGGREVFSLQFRVLLENENGSYRGHNIGWASNISNDDEEELLLYDRGDPKIRDCYDDAIAIISGTGITAARLQLQNCIIEDWRPMLGHNRREIEDCKIKRTKLERWIIPARLETKNAGKIQK